MLTRRLALAAALASPVLPALATGGFDLFLASLRVEAAHAGIRREVIEAALTGLTPNADVIRLDRHQPEFTLTWAQYRARVLPARRLAAARDHYARNETLFTEIGTHYGVDPGVIIGIWGLESGFGVNTGGFSVVQALATLAYDGRRAAFFRGELLNALRILNDGDVTTRRMTGSYAGAMGQPQFMPSAYLHYAVDYDGDGRRDIWTSLPDVFASVANYLARCGWHAGEPWGQPVLIPAGYSGPSGRDAMRPLGHWQAAGIRRIDGRPFSRADVPAALVLPDGAGGEAYMVYHNFHVIRRYNPSDFYALAVGLLGYEAA
ncbi:MAG TPA: lytic murein transglycosylase [Acetobacteraceae bacterium]|nr:lytic murein transglycosylase [Acetobacteraceae bacterium]